MPTLGGRLLQTAAYHIPLAISLAMISLAALYPRFGAALYFVIGTVFTWLVFTELCRDGSLGAILSWLPVTVLLIGVGFLWWFGKPRPLKLALWVALGAPLLASGICAIEPIARISQRDMRAQLRECVVQGNGVELTWAPPGPGWVRSAKESCDWEAARDRCARLSADGTRLLDRPVNVWRLPTAEEAVRSLTRHGKNAGGTYDPAKRRATYKINPDKEPPLWDPLAETIYWWTADNDGEDRADIIVWNGLVSSRTKSEGMGSKGFRAVRAP